MTTTPAYKPEHLSYSSLSSYTQCGERFRLEKVLHVPSIPSWSLVGGSAVHQVTEDLDRALFFDGPVNMGDDDIAAAFTTAFEAQVEEQVERCGFPTEAWHRSGRATKDWPNKEDRAWWMHNGPGMVQAWVRWRDRTGWVIWLNGDEPAIEIHVLPSFGGGPVKQYIDRVMVTPAGELVVLDLKTGAREPEADQLGAYATGMEQVLGVRPSYGTYWLARTGGTGLIHNMDAWPQARLDHEYAEGRRGMEAGLFPAKKSNLCGSCGVKRACYAVKGELSSEYTPFSL